MIGGAGHPNQPFVPVAPVFKPTSGPRGRVYFAQGPDSGAWWYQPEYNKPPPPPETEEEEEQSAPIKEYNIAEQRQSFQDKPFTAPWRKNNPNF